MWKKALDEESLLERMLSSLNDTLLKIHFHLTQFGFLWLSTWSPIGWPRGCEESWCKGRSNLLAVTCYLDNFLVDVIELLLKQFQVVNQGCHFPPHPRKWFNLARWSWLFVISRSFCSLEIAHLRKIACAHQNTCLFPWWLTAAAALVKVATFTHSFISNC